MSVSESENVVTPSEDHQIGLGFWGGLLTLAFSCKAAKETFLFLTEQAGKADLLNEGTAIPILATTLGAAAAPILAMTWLSGWESESGGEPAPEPQRPAPRIP